MRRQFRLYQERDAGYARADKHKLLPHTCSQQVRQRVVLRPDAMAGVVAELV